MTRPLRTIADLLTDANAAESAAAAESFLVAAAAQASQSRDWDAILDGIPASVPIAVHRRLVADALESARASEEIWGFRKVALIQAQRFHEPTAARETLRAAERMLLENASQGRGAGYQFGTLAEAFKEALLDESEARRAMQAGWDMAWAQRDVEDLGRLANRWASVLDRAEAVALLTRVEEAAAEWGELGGVIYWWHALGDAAAGNRVRHAVLERTSRFEEALDLARYWTLYEKDSPGVEAAFARAEALARTTDEWFELAAEAHSKFDDGTLSRRALDRAAQSADTARRKAQIAAAYLDWFEDERAAERSGPCGVQAEELRPRCKKLDGWEGSAADLFDWLRTRVSHDCLMEIAQADYGDDTERHFAALDRMCKTGQLPLSLAWHPGEVVALTRWSTGPTLDHFARALSCVLLCLCSHDDDLVNTGPPMIESCLALGADAASSAERFLVWNYETMEFETPESYVYLFALFMLHAAQQPGDPHLVNLLEKMIETGHIRGLRQWLADSIRAGLWAQLIDEILMPLHQSQPALSPLLDTIGFSRSQEK